MLQCGNPGDERFYRRRFEPEMLLWDRNEEALRQANSNEDSSDARGNWLARGQEAMVNLLPKPSPDAGVEGHQVGAISRYSIVVLAKDQVSCKLGEDFAVLNLKNSSYYGLKHSAAHVWDLLQDRRPRTVAQLRDSIVEKYEVGEERTETDLVDLLAKMRTSGLIEVQKAQLAGTGSKRHYIEEVLAPDTTVDITHPPCSKKPYLKPHLCVYGRIEEITRQGGTGTAGDNRGKLNGKTGG